MMSRVLEVKNHDFTSEDRLFLDANIWLYIYGPQKPKDWRVKIYSGMLKRIINKKSTIYIDVLVVSEIINRYARLKWQLFASGMDFKDFRESKGFIVIAQEISDVVRRVVKHCSRLESGFMKLEINTILDTYSQGNSDFNDQVVTEICKDKRLTFITHDADFKGQGISILTANRRLLN